MCVGVGVCVCGGGVSAYLVLFPHHGQRFDVVFVVFPLLQTLHAHRSLAAVAVHAEVFRFVIQAGRGFPRGSGRLLTPAPTPACRTASCRLVPRRYQAVLGERTTGRVAPLLAGVTVVNIALLAHHRRVHRVAVAQLALHRGGGGGGGGSGAVLLVPRHYGLQQPVPRETPEPPLVQGDAPVTQRAGEGAVPVVVGRREHPHPVRTLELARCVGAVPAVRLAVQTHLVHVQVVVVRAARRSALHRGLSVRGLDGDVPGTRQADIVGARQQDGVLEEGPANGAF